MAAAASVTNTLPTCTLIDSNEVLTAHRGCVCAAEDQGISFNCYLIHFPLNIRQEIFDCLGPLKALSLRICKPLRLEEGWHQTECNDDAFRKLLVAKTQLIFEKAAARKATPRTEPIAQGFWYANEFLLELKARKAQALIVQYRQADSFYTGLPPSSFELIPDRATATGYSIGAYKLAKTAPSPSAALANVESTLCFIDCQIALEVGCYQTLLEVWGKRRFDTVFSYEGRSPLRLDPNFMNTPLALFFTRSQVHFGQFGTRPVVSGDMTHFKHFASYSSAHPNGEAGGFHVMTLAGATQKFAGFGLPLQGATEGEIYDLFKVEYEKKPIAPETMCSPALATKLKQVFAEQNKIYAAQLRMTVADYLKVQSTQNFTRKAFIDAQTEYPGQVGFIPLVTRPDMAAIKKAFESAPAKPTAPSPKK